MFVEAQSRFDIPRIILLKHTHIHIEYIYKRPIQCRQPKKNTAASNGLQDSAPLAIILLLPIHI